MVAQVKEKRGTIERVIQDQSVAIVKGLFKKETDPAVYTGLKVGSWIRHAARAPCMVVTAQGLLHGCIPGCCHLLLLCLLQVTTGKGEAGIIDGSFGKSGKLRVRFPAGITAEGRSPADDVVLLTCKRYLYDPDRKRLKQ